MNSSTRSSTHSDSEETTIGGCVEAQTFNLTLLQQPRSPLLAPKTCISNIHDIGQTLARTHLGHLEARGVIQDFRSSKDKLVNSTGPQLWFRDRMDDRSCFDGSLVDRLIPSKDSKKEKAECALHSYSLEFWRSYLGIPQVCESFFLMLKLVYLYEELKLCEILRIDCRNWSDSKLREFKLALWDYFYSLCPGCPLAEDLREGI